MKNFFLLLLLIVVLASCKKEYSAYTEPGTTQADTSAVKRLVMVDGFDSIIYSFSYTTSRRLSSLTISEVFDGVATNSLDTFIRNPVSGNIQQSIFIIYDSSLNPPNYYDTTYYKFSSNGQLQARYNSNRYGNYGDSTELFYLTGKLNREIEYAITPFGNLIVMKRDYTIDGGDRVFAVFDSAYSLNTGLFTARGKQLYLYVDSVENPLQLHSADRAVFMLKNYGFYNSYPSINFFTPYLFNKETQEYNSGNTSFDFSSFQLEKGKPVRIQLSRLDADGLAPLELRYYYSD